MQSERSRTRRDALALAGALFGTTALAGCTGAVGDQESTGTSTAETGATATDESTPDGEATDGDETPTPTELAMDGLVTVEREESVADVVTAISSAIEANENLNLMTTVDHAENAATVDQSLPPTTLLLFGNPGLGTQLMNDQRTVAIDLPQKLLVFADEAGTTVVYNDPAYLARRHGLTASDEVLDTISGALDMLANAPVEQTETGSATETDTANETE
ncbi:DUF302 domain-containing protein [Halobacteria archaeon HArc-gm2]|nr:DUF302 domain-containing protein [Halobacteria archaeon HArc-gm2]